MALSGMHDPAVSAIINALAVNMLDTLACNAGREQMRVLSEILTHNANTEYLRRLDVLDAGRGGSVDNIVHTFKQVAPVITYDDIKPLIKRITDGDRSPILTAHPISLLLLSSGTSSGEPRFIPTHDADIQKREAIFRLPFAILARAMQEVGLAEDSSATKMLNFLFIKPEFSTPSGLPVRTFITNICRSETFCAHVPSVFTSPLEVFHCEDVLQSMYCHLLCGLIRRSEVGCVNVVFAFGLLNVMHFLEKWWRELVKDIHDGTLSSDAVSDPTVRKTVEALIASWGGPNPALAAQVEVECERHPKWQGIIRRLWPQAKFVCAIVTGSMSQYVTMLEFYIGGLPLVSFSYAAAECYFGVNMSPLCPPSSVSYMLLPNMAYFEFLPCSTPSAVDIGSHVDQHNNMHSMSTHNQAQLSAAATDHEALISTSSLIDLVDVKLGEEYELVVTTYTGLYRYRMGDVLRVTGFHRKAPLFEFVRRANVLLSIDCDKTDEETLQRAVEAAASAHLEAAGWHLVDYTSFADIYTAPGHYVLFWEVSGSDSENRLQQVSGVEDIAAGRRLDAAALEACCLVIEENLGIAYKWLRGPEKSIGPLEIRVVQGGTFDAVMEFLCEQRGSSKGSSFSQYKTPRCVNKQQHAAILDLLDSRVSISAAGPQCPVFASLPS